MTQENKQLLLQDLCTRLPYGVYVDYSYNAFDVHKGKYIKCGSKYILKCYLLDVFLSPRQDEKGEYIKPYLRPMSSMTEEEVDEFTQFDVYAEGEYIMSNYEMIDWLNKNMFDYRGLISKGLALEAPDGMYNIKKHNKI